MNVLCRKKPPQASHFGQMMMRQKYVVSNIQEKSYVEDTVLQLLWDVRKQ